MVCRCGPRLVILLDSAPIVLIEKIFGLRALAACHLFLQLVKLDQELSGSVAVRQAQVPIQGGPSQCPVRGATSGPDLVQVGKCKSEVQVVTLLLLSRWALPLRFQGRGVPLDERHRVFPATRG